MSPAGARRRSLRKTLVSVRKVALYQGRVVGHGVDDEALAQRMFESLGDVPFYIAKVEPEPTVYDLPSPETVP